MKRQSKPSDARLFCGVNIHERPDEIGSAISRACLKQVSRSEQNDLAPGIIADTGVKRSKRLPLLPVGPRGQKLLKTEMGEVVASRHPFNGKQTRMAPELSRLPLQLQSFVLCYLLALENPFFEEIEKIRLPYLADLSFLHHSARYCHKPHPHLANLLITASGIGSKPPLQEHPHGILVKVGQALGKALAEVIQGGDHGQEKRIALHAIQFRVLAQGLPETSMHFPGSLGPSLSVYGFKPSLNEQLLLGLVERKHLCHRSFKLQRMYDALLLDCMGARSKQKSITTSGFALKKGPNDLGGAQTHRRLKDFIQAVEQPDAGNPARPRG
jgi:hypothetical protein